MIALAFKRGTSWYSEAIYKVTGGEFSHVELVLDWPDPARCYSSREPDGTGFMALELSDASTWSIVPLHAPSEQDHLVLLWYCRGSSGRKYDYRGIAGIGLDKSNLQDSSARFCSEEVLTVLQNVLGMFPGVKPWMVAPSGFGKGDGRYGLYELVTGKEKVG